MKLTVHKKLLHSVAWIFSLVVLVCAVTDSIADCLDFDDRVGVIDGHRVADTLKDLTVSSLETVESPVSLPPRHLASISSRAPPAES